jgi:hypothetical protein
MLTLWAEMNLVLADQFRDGNVPALMTRCRWPKPLLGPCRRRSRPSTIEGIRPAMSIV